LRFGGSHYGNDSFGYPTLNGRAIPDILDRVTAPYEWATSLGSFRHCSRHVLEARATCKRVTAAEFRGSSTDHSGTSVNLVTGALAHLQLGRVQVMMGDKIAACKSYNDFLMLGKDADRDIPIYRQARAEYAKLMAELPALVGKQGEDTSKASLVTVHPQLICGCTAARAACTIYQ